VITHVVTFKWRPDTTLEYVERIRAALGMLPDLVPEIKTYRFGSDLGASPLSSYDFAIVATFDSIDDWHSYDKNADHESVRAVIRPAVAERGQIQFES
jgi:Stress responsive A/B Barrel Domain